MLKSDASTVGAVAERLGLESITPLVKRLESAGLVSRARNPNDERQVQARLTPRGREIRDECGCLAEELLARSGMTGGQLGEAEPEGSGVTGCGGEISGRQS